MSKNDKKTVAVKVQIFGREYPVACPQGEEHALLQSAKYVDSEMHKVRQNGKVVGTDRIAVMVSLNIAHELLLSHRDGKISKVAAASADPDTEVSQQRLEAMHERLDNALQQYQQYVSE